MNGIIVLNKPPGITSHDAVFQARKILGEKSIGHLGTLDPLATGVLVLVAGAASRLAEFAPGTKEYIALCLLGKSTDSEDISGKVLLESPVPSLEATRVRGAVESLRSITEQVPPMVSAVKQGGVRLYKLARKGKTVERKARPVTIEEAEFLGYDAPRLSFRVKCSGGTYVRSLCRLIGESLGIPACLEKLERTQSGPFKIGEGLTLEDLARLAKAGDLGAFLRPAHLLVEHIPGLPLAPEEVGKLCRGLDRPADKLPGGWVRILNEKGLLCAMAYVEEGRLKPKKVFGVEGI